MLILSVRLFYIHNFALTCIMILMQLCWSCCILCGWIESLFCTHFTCKTVQILMGITLAGSSGFILIAKTITQGLQGYSDAQLIGFIVDYAGEADWAPPSKRRRVSSTAPNPDTDPASIGVPTSEPSAIAAQFTELLKAAMPDISKAVVGTLTSLGLVAPSSAAHTPSSEVLVDTADAMQPPHLFNTRTDGTTISPRVIAATGTVPDTTQSSTPAPACMDPFRLDSITSSGTAGTGPTSTLSHIARPLDLGLDPRIRAKIWADEYVDLGSLIVKHPLATKLEMVQEGGGICLVQRDHKFKFRNMEHWMRAFHIFVAVYCQRFPEQSPHLMAYANRIQTLSSQAGEASAFFYDEQFRLWRATDPDSLPWQLTNDLLFMEAISYSVSSKVRSMGQSSFRGGSRGGASSRGGTTRNGGRADRRQGKCFDFNGKGKCSRASCAFSHTCQVCDGPHGKKSCPKKGGPNAGASHTGGVKARCKHPSNLVGWLVGW